MLYNDTNIRKATVTIAIFRELHTILFYDHTNQQKFTKILSNHFKIYFSFICVDLTC